MRRSLGAALAVCCLASAPALAYWGATHGKFNTEVITRGKWPGFTRGNRQVTDVNGYLQNVLYLSEGQQRQVHGVKFRDPTCLLNTCLYTADKPTDPPDDARTVLDFNVMAGFWEDGFEDYAAATKWGGLRAVNHFHVPTGARKSDGGYSGIIRGAPNFVSHQPYYDLLRSGVSAIRWAQGANSGGDTNYWTWPAAVDALGRFFTETDLEKRQSGLAGAFRALGHVMHLVQDNTVPDHPRDLAHPGDGYEEYARDEIGGSGFRFPSQSLWPAFPLKYVEEKGLGAFWDRDVYSTSPAATLSSTDLPGISEYTQANFLAWNVKLVHLSDITGWIAAVPAPVIPVPLSTIPYTWGVGFEDFSWPHYQKPVVVSPDFGGWGASEAGTVPVPKLMRFTPSAGAREPNNLNGPLAATKGNVLDADCWAGYLPPLVNYALGYSRSLVPMLLQPARAEVVPDPADPLMKARVRLWNLAPTQSPYAVTWHLDEAQLVPLNTRVQGADPTPISVTFGSEPTVAPGALVTSDAFTITLKQRGALAWASYSAVLVKGHLGDTVKTPISIAVPIPNGFPVVKHLSLTDLTSPTTVNVQCDTSPCGDESNVVTIRQPLTQRVSVALSLAAPWVDVLGAPAAQTVKDAAAEDVHIAGLAVGAWLPEGGSSPSLTAPRWPSTPAFTVPATLEQQPSEHAAIRRRDAADVREPAEVSLDITVRVTDYANTPPETLSTTEGAHLAIWTTSGALYLVRLVLWPAWDQTAASTHANDIACNLPAEAQVAALSVGGCFSPSSAPMCTTGPSKSYSYARLYSPWLGLGGIDVGPGLQGAWASVTNLVQLEKLGGVNVTAGALGAIETPCDGGVLGNWNGRTATNVCNPGSGGVLMSSTYSEGSPNCPSTAQKVVPFSATMKPLATGAQISLWTEAFGRTDVFPDFTYTAN